jgi:hypothetical protein
LASASVVNCPAAVGVPVAGARVVAGRVAVGAAGALVVAAGLAGAGAGAVAAGFYCRATFAGRPLSDPNQTFSIAATDHEVMKE